MKFYALPMFDAMADMFPEMRGMAAAVRASYDVWSEMPKLANT